MSDTNSTSGRSPSRPRRPVTRSMFRKARRGFADSDQDDDGSGEYRLPDGNTKQRSRDDDEDSDDSAYARPGKRTRRSSIQVPSQRAEDMKIMQSIQTNEGLRTNLFKYVHARDILSLSRTCKLLRKLLMTRNANNNVIWERSRKNAGLPSCPDIPLPYWIDLVYGDRRICTCCRNANDAATVIWSFRHRLCPFCMSVYIMSSADFPEEFPDMTGETLQLLPHTHLGPSGKPSDKKCYWRRHIWNLQIQNARLGPPGPAARNVMKNTVKNIMEVASQMDDWIQKDKKAQLFEQFKTCMRGYQFQGADVEKVRRDVERSDILQRTATMSPAALLSLYKTFRPAMVAAREKRLLAEKKKQSRLIFSRIRAAYQDYRKTLDPSYQPYLPGIGSLLRLSLIHQAIWPPTGYVTTMTEVADICKDISDLVIKGREQLEASLLDELPHPKSRLGPVPPLELATTIYSCELCHRSVFGMSAFSHACSKLSLEHKDVSTKRPEHITNDSLPFRFSGTTSREAKRLVQLAGLNVNLTRVQDMDNSKVRFACAAAPCTILSDGSITGFVMNWRECIEHASLWKDHKDSVRCLSDEELSSGHSKLTDDELLPDEKAWMCLHCSDLQKSSKHTVTVHIETKHSVRDAKYKRDYMWNESVKRKWELRRVQLSS